MTTMTLIYQTGDDHGIYVAAILADDDSVMDYAYNWQTAQNYALSEGARVVALADDGRMTRDDIQAMCDAERARFRDCYGIEPMA